MSTLAEQPLHDDAAGGSDNPLARIYGEPILELPQDLYIPPDALAVMLDAFEGPLDLLLYLIRKQNLDVLDIPMAQMTRQYLEYVELMRENQLELAAEYLLMAALLIEIKSRMLLPRPAAQSEDDGVGDPRAELVRRLLEYEQMKQAAQQLDRVPQSGRDFRVVEVLFERAAIERLPEVELADLHAAWLTIINRARVNKHHTVTRESLSVREQMSRVLRLLQGQDFVPFVELFAEDADVPHAVVTFLAILELAREQLVSISQQEEFAPIYVKLRMAEHVTEPA